MGKLAEEILEALRQEFSDLPDPSSVIRVMVRLLVAGLLGGLIGFERQLKGRSAGLRTHMLVALGSACFLLIPQQAGVPMPNLDRIAAGLITGIGFLGAGAIFKAEGEGQPRGLTTAAAIWLTAAVGMTVGMGRLSSAVVITALSLVILAPLSRLDRMIDRAAKDVPSPDPECRNARSQDRSLPNPPGESGK